MHGQTNADRERERERERDDRHFEEGKQWGDELDFGLALGRGLLVGDTVALLSPAVLENGENREWGRRVEMLYDIDK